MAAALSDADIMRVVTTAGWTGADAVTAVAVVLAESGGRPDAVNKANSNGTSDHGLFQINSIHTAILASGNRYDPNDNARMAMRVFKDAGSKWTPWSTYNSRRYAMYLPRANKVAGTTGSVDDSDPSPDPSQVETNPDFKSVTSSDTWFRVGLFTAGAVLLILFALSAAKSSGIGSVIPITRALKTVRKVT